MVGAAQGFDGAVDLQGRQGYRRPLPDGRVIAVQEADEGRAAAGISHLLEDLDGGQLSEAAQRWEPLDDGGDGVGADPDQLRRAS
jgi:hypothetical protein